MTVHVGTLLFVPLIAAVVYLLLRGVEGTAAQRRRVGRAPFVLCYATWEALIGIGVGVLADEVNGLPAAEQDAGAKVLEEFADSGIIRAFELIGTGSLFVALTAAGIALRRRADAPLAVPVLLVLAAVPIAWHVRPFGQVGLALFIAAVLLVVQSARPGPERGSRRCRAAHGRVNLGSAPASHWAAMRDDRGLAPERHPPSLSRVTQASRMRLSTRSEWTVRREVARNEWTSGLGVRRCELSGSSRSVLDGLSPHLDVRRRLLVGGVRSLRGKPKWRPVPSGRLQARGRPDG